MESLLKKFLYTSVGFVSIAGEKMAKAVEELIDDGKLSEEEGKIILDDFFKTSESKKEEFETNFKNVIENTIEKLKFARNKDMEKLKERIANLEKLIKEKEKTKKKTTTKKATTKKKTTKPKEDKK